MHKIAAVLIGMASLSPLVSNLQDKGKKQAPDWVEVTPEKGKPKEVKRVMKLQDGLVFDIGFVREPFMGGRDSVNAKCFISNPTKKTLKAGLYVAVFDKEKRLISAGMLSWGNSDMSPAFKPGEKNEGWGLVLEAPSEELDRIAFAQGRLYVKE